MKKIVDIKELRVDDIPLVGGKGANLGELTSAGFHVPGAFVLTTAAYDYFVEKNRLADRIKEELASIDRSSDQSLTNASKRVRTLFETCDIPEASKRRS
jgi:pyruvate,water dikinase